MTKTRISNIENDISPQLTEFQRKKLRREAEIFRLYNQIEGMKSQVVITIARRFRCSVSSVYQAVARKKKEADASH